MKELTELEMLQIKGGDGEAYPVLKSDGEGHYFEWPDGSWVAVDWFA